MTGRRFDVAWMNRMLAPRFPEGERTSFPVDQFFLGTVEYNPERKSAQANIKFGDFSGHLGLFDQPTEAEAKRNMPEIVRVFNRQIERVFDGLKSYGAGYGPNVSFRGERLPEGVRQIDVDFIPPISGREYHLAFVNIFKTESTKQGKPDISLSVSKRY